MKSNRFSAITSLTTSTCCCLLLSLTLQVIAITGQSVFVRAPQAALNSHQHRDSSQQQQQHPSSADLQPAESSALGLYPGVGGGLHSLSPGLGGYGHAGAVGGYGMPLHSSGTYGSSYGGGGGGIGGIGGGGLSSGSYDDLHKYGGIGKKAHTSSLYDHGSKGYKDYYGDAAYGNQGLNKYSNQHSSDNFGGSKGGHANYQGGHVYTRNRGYGYEKHYMYDKEFSTAKSGGSKGGHHSYYGDHKKGGQSSLKAFKNYGGKKYGAKKGHDDHAYGKYGHLMDDHGEHYLKSKAGLDKVALLPHLESSYSSGGIGGGGDHGGYMGGHNEYMPVIESYGGALGHGGGGGHLPSMGYDHGADHGAMMDTYDTQPNPSVVYPGSRSSAEVGGGGGSSAEQMDDVAEPMVGKHILSSTSSPIMNSNSAPLISTKLGSSTSSHLGTPPVYATIGSAFNRAGGVSRGGAAGGSGLVNSAVHATPAVISTSSGAHYYNS